MVRILELIKIESHASFFSKNLMGQPPAERKALAKCFAAKGILEISTEPRRERRVFP